MGFNNGEAMLCVSQAGGNVGLGMVRYIARNGCNGFRCKGCVLKLVCTRYPTDARDVAFRVLLEVDRQRSGGLKA